MTDEVIARLVGTPVSVAVPTGTFRKIEQIDGVLHRNNGSGYIVASGAGVRLVYFSAAGVVAVGQSPRPVIRLAP